MLNNNYSENRARAAFARAQASYDAQTPDGDDETSEEEQRERYEDAMERAYEKKMEDKMFDED